MLFVFYLFFFFKQKTSYEMRISDWSSDVCSSDLVERGRHDLITHREDAEDRFDRACTAEQVPDRRFGRTHRQIPDRIAEQPPHRAKLQLVAERGRGDRKSGV